MVQESKRIKILFTIPNFDTAGSGKALLNVALRLDKDLFEPHIMCMHDRGFFFETVKKSKIPVHIFNYTTQMKPYNKGIINCYRISRALKRIRPDIIHSFHYAADYSEPLAAKFAGIPWVYTKKNMNWGGASKNGWLLRTKFAKKIAVQNTDMLSQFFLKNTSKTKLIPRGVNTKEFYPQQPDSKLKEKWGILDDKRVLICVANLVPVKGIEILLQAFSKGSNLFNDWVLIIVGDNNNEYGEKMKDLTLQLKLENKIIFTGKQPNVIDYLNLAEVFVLTTLNEGRKEGSPVSLLEAMATEKFVLGSKIPGIKDQLNKFPDNMVEAGSVDAWTHALKMSLTKEKKWLKAKGVLFRKHILDNYTIEKEVQNCEEMYIDIYTNK